MDWKTSKYYESLNVSHVLKSIIKLLLSLLLLTMQWQGKRMCLLSSGQFWRYNCLWWASWGDTVGSLPLWSHLAAEAQHHQYSNHRPSPTNHPSFMHHIAVTFHKLTQCFNNTHVMWVTWYETVPLIIINMYYQTLWIQIWKDWHNIDVCKI